MTITAGVGGALGYGNLKDNAGALSEIERIKDWLMDPQACPTTWPTLLNIRAENPLSGQGTPAATL